MNIAEMITDQISIPFAKSIKALKDLGFPKDKTMMLITQMVDYAYGTDEERKRLREELNNGR